MANITKEERERRANNINENALSPDNGNPRVPVYPVREGAEPITPAAGAYAVGTPGTAEPESVEKVEAIKHEAAARVPTFPVKFKRGYFPKDGGAKITEGTERELPIEEARYVIEAGIADRADALPSV